MTTNSDDPMLTWSEQAQAEAARMAREIEAYRDRPLRVYIEGKGCDGFYYGVAFDEKLTTDTAYRLPNGLEVVIDPDSLPFLKGSTVEWVDDERGKGFLVENPSHARYRGKFYKKAAWQDALQKKVEARAKAKATSSSSPESTSSPPAEP